MDNNIKILIVDDDPVFLFLHEKLLKKVGIQVSIDKCGDGQQALEFIQGYPIDTLFFVLLDINMPVMNGWEFLRSIQSLPYYDRIKAFIVSSATQDGERDQEKQFPQIIGSFNKPLTLDDCWYVNSLIQSMKSLS